MTLVNFDSASAVRTAPPKEKPYSQAMRRRTDLLGSSEAWRPLRDYVMGRVEDHHGAQVRDSLKEAGTFKGFAKRWGPLAEPIARYLMEDCGGWWNNRPVLMTAFCRGSDDYVARPVAERLSR